MQVDGSAGHGGLEEQVVCPCALAASLFPSVGSGAGPAEPGPLLSVDLSAGDTVTGCLEVGTVDPSGGGLEAGRV